MKFVICCGLDAIDITSIELRIACLQFRVTGITCNVTLKRYFSFNSYLVIRWLIDRRQLTCDQRRLDGCSPYVHHAS
jgi:hypothetical protein